MIPFLIETKSAVLRTENDVVRNGKLIHVCHVLINNGDSVRGGLSGRFDPNGLPVDPKLAAVNTVGTGKDLDQG